MNALTLAAARRVHHDDYSVSSLVEAKGSTTVSVCLPARDEEPTVGEIVRVVRRALMNGVGLVDEILVVDDHSSDATARVAEAAGARVVRTSRLGHADPGKGRAMATALVASSGDVVVFCDADVQNFSSNFVTGLLGPLLSDPTIQFVKGTYRRPLVGNVHGGGRVTELVAKPLLDELVGDVSGFTQPLAGEVAFRRSAVEGISFVPDYGVDVALLIDVVRKVGITAAAEVDLGERLHRNRPLHELVPQARSVVAAILARALPAI